MTDTAKAIPNRGYHAHIYYDPEKTRPTAERLCAVIGNKFQVEFGGFRDEPIGAASGRQRPGHLQARAVSARRRVADAAPRRP